MSSRSRSSESRSYTSYSSSSHSRSRSSSSSSDHSSYSRSSSYTVSSRSRSPRYDPRSPPHKTKRKVAHQSVPRSSSDKSLEHHYRKKPRYSDNLSPPPDAYYHESHSHRRISKNTQYSHYPRKRPSDRHENVSHHSPPKPRRPEQSAEYYHQSRHHMDKHKISRPSHHSPPPPHYSHRLPPPRSHIQKERHRNRPPSYDSGSYHSKPSYVEPVHRRRNRSGYLEGERSSSSHRQPAARPHHSSSRGNGHNDHKSTSAVAQIHEARERFIVVEESTYPEESQPSRKSSGKSSSHRSDSSRAARDNSPDRTPAEKPVGKELL